IEGRQYSYRTGYDQFKSYFKGEFPREREGIDRFCGIVKYIGESISVDTMRSGLLSSKDLSYLGVTASDLLDETFEDQKLKNALAGNSSLYGGIKGVTSMYHFGMINHSFIESPYRIAGGSQQVADALTEAIRSHGGTVLTGKRVTRIGMGESRVEFVEVNGGEERFTARHYISSAHPVTTFSLVDKTPLIRKAYISRLRSLKNSYGIFSAYLLMKPGMFPYMNRNYYFYKTSDAWDTEYDTEADSPRAILMSMQASREPKPYAEIVNLRCAMRIGQLDRWAYSTPENRGDDYRSFKERTAGKLIDIACENFPQLHNAIDSIYTTTPLTYRDYTGIPEGSAYGIIKDSRSPLTSLIPVKTKIQNLLLTGQNMNVHGALGVALTAAITCAELVGEEYLAKKIGGC
ncbi:MAG: FAD-dependent oxidoreductase, partial [Alistipes sp.]|nr:FAD-dependent oxidoreductase [Alistipes sp.]